MDSKTNVNADQIGLIRIYTVSKNIWVKQDIKEKFNLGKN